MIKQIAAISSVVLFLIFIVYINVLESNYKINRASITINQIDSLKNTTIIDFNYNGDLCKVFIYNEERVIQYRSVRSEKYNLVDKSSIYVPLIFDHTDLFLKYGHIIQHLMKDYQFQARLAPITHATIVKYFCDKYD